MRAVVLTDPGVLELTWMWLPTWIGMNYRLKERLDQMLAEEIEGKRATPEVLDKLNDRVLGILAQECPLPGLVDYLDGLKFVQEP